jgi:hypothetical protein
MARKRKRIGGENGGQNGERDGGNEDEMNESSNIEAKMKWQRKSIEGIMKSKRAKKIIRRSEMSGEAKWRGVVKMASAWR